MIVWSGLGFLTPLYAFVCILIANSLMPTLDARIGIAFLVAAVANWFTGKKLNTGEVRTLRDEATGEVIEVKKTHTFFWIAMEWWSIGFALLGAYTLIKTH